MPSFADPLPTWNEVVASLAGHGVEHVGVAPAAVLERARSELFRRRAMGYADEMGFTYRNPDRSTDPDRAVTGARSMIVAALRYSSVDTAKTCGFGASGRIARYAQADHYAVLRTALRAVADRLKLAGERATVFVDDNAMVDREAAYLGGLGWYGKNANLLVPGVGSYVVLGSIITTAEFPASTPVADGCGPCRRCIDQCPTAAIIEPGVVDARRCLAWLVQRAGSFPLEFREALGDRFYGCDDCQEACPPAVRFGRRYDAAPTDEVDRSTMAWVDLIHILTASDEDLLAAYGRWYIAERDPRWWRRTALIVVGNSADPDDGEVRNLLRAYRDGADPILAEHAEWALQRLDDRLEQPERVG